MRILGCLCSQLTGFIRSVSSALSHLVQRVGQVFKKNTQDTEEQLLNVAEKMEKSMKFSIGGKTKAGEACYASALKSLNIIENKAQKGVDSELTKLERLAENCIQSQSAILRRRGDGASSEVDAYLAAIKEKQDREFMKSFPEVPKTKP